MGITHVKGEVFGPRGGSETVRFLVDSGATYSLLPKESWTKLDLTPLGKVYVELADGRQLERPLAECKMRLDGAERHSPVLLGEDGDEALIGAVTLENFGFVLDPLKRKLVPMRVRG